MTTIAGPLKLKLTDIAQPAEPGARPRCIRCNALLTARSYVMIVTDGQGTAWCGVACAQADGLTFAPAKAD